MKSSISSPCGFRNSISLKRKRSCSFVSDSLQPMDCSLPGFCVHGIFQAKYWNGLPFVTPKNGGKGRRSLDVRTQSPFILPWVSSGYLPASAFPQPSPYTSLSGPIYPYLTFSVQFSQSVMSNSLRPCGLQHTRPPCPSRTPGVHPNSCPLSR